MSVPLEAAIDSYPPLVDYGLFGWQIAPFVEAYGADAICLTSLERLRAAPEVELARIATHIGHTGPVRWHEENDQDNMSSERVRKLPMHHFLVHHPLATALRRSLIPKALRSRIRAARQMSERPAIPAERLPELRDRFTADRAVLASFFPGDLSLDLAYPCLI